MIDYIDSHKETYGVEPICAQLPIAPSTYYAAKARPPSARACRDAVMMSLLLALWTTNRKVYGADKLWRAARREGHDIGRDQVARLMRRLDIRGVSRQRKRVFTTRPDPDAVRPPDLVNRDFTATAPDRLWVTDLTYVPTRSGMAYVCFIVDAFSRRIVGWRVAGHMRTDMVLDALEMARRSRGAGRLTGLVAHADAGSQFTSVRFTERLAEIGARPSIGTVADSYDNALAETTNGLYKTECVRGPDAPAVWNDVDQVETMSWVHWFNDQRLHSHCDHTPPTEFEQAFYAAQTPTPTGVGNQYPEPPSNPVRFSSPTPQRQANSAVTRSQCSSQGRRGLCGTLAWPGRLARDWACLPERCALLSSAEPVEASDLHSARLGSLALGCRSPSLNHGAIVMAQEAQ